MIHATLANGQTMLFYPNEKVWTADWISDNGEYFSGEKRGPAWELIKPGAFVIDHNAYGPCIESEVNSKIVRVICVPDNLSVARKRKKCPPRW